MQFYRNTRLMLLGAIMMLSAVQVSAQGKGKDKDHKDWDKGRKEYKSDKNWNKDKKYHSSYSNRSGQHKGNKARGPRKLAGVPPGHYPPPGSCRIWYPNRPPGQQPPPTSCNNLYGTRLEPGAFIMYGDRYYDAEYDWRQEERLHPGTVSDVIINILFP